MKVDRKSLLGRPCIYKITNIVDGKIYIGKAKCLVSRSYQYNSSFRNFRHDHINDYLFNAMVKYEYRNFIIEPIEFCDLDKLAERELFWIQTLNSNVRAIGYNLRLDSSTGMIASPETITKITKNITNQWATGVRSKHGEKLSLALARNPEWRKEIGKNFSKALTKYQYTVMFHDWTTEICNYQRLQELELSNVLATFWKKGINTVIFKKHLIKRELVL